MAAVLKNAGDDLARANLVKEAANIRNVEIESVPPCLRVNVGPTDYAPMSQLQLMRIKGEAWELFGSVRGLRPATEAWTWKATNVRTAKQIMSWVDCARVSEKAILQIDCDSRERSAQGLENHMQRLQP